VVLTSFLSVLLACTRDRFHHHQDKLGSETTLLLTPCVAVCPVGGCRQQTNGAVVLDMVVGKRMVFVVRPS
jgi:hypothetical protein